MTNVLEIDNMGDTIKIITTDSTTASDVVSRINNVWPGTAQSISEMGVAFQNVTESVANVIKEQKRKQKHIDRIAWEAERRQRYQKGGHFK